MTSHSTYENGRLTVTRYFEAPRETVFDAWVATSKVKLWWGCADAESVDSIVEPRPGGQYSHTMMLKGVGEYRHHGIITAYEPPQLLEYRLHDRFHEQPMLVRVEFTQQGNRTKVHLTQDNLPETYSAFVQAGWAEGFEKLNMFLTTEQTTGGAATQTISS